MSYQKLRELVEKHEGRVPHAYQDSLGYWTIGVGHLIDKRRGGKLPEHIVDALLDHDIAMAGKELFHALPWTESLDEVRQAVLIDMAFNLGLGGLLKFKETLRYVEAGEYANASVEMLDGPWARQVGVRATELSQMMRTGRWA